MADNETIADIIAEMRKDKRVDSNLMWDNSQVEEHDLHYADRLEAAHKRERGDAAKLREALTKILNLTNSLDEDCAVDPVEIRDIAKAALAAPARNCDVGAPEEQSRRFDQVCSFRFTGNCAGCKNPLDDSAANGVSDCALFWAQLPYEEGGAK